MKSLERTLNQWVEGSIPSGRTLCMSICALLQTADSLVMDASQSTITGNNITTGNSKDINEPKGLVPEFFYRFYTNKQSHPHILLYVAVILDNRYDNPAYTPKDKENFEEPILTAGYFDYGNEEVVEQHVWREDYLKAHFFSEEKKYDGKICNVEPEKMICFAKQIKSKTLGKKELFALPLKLKSLALPLININDTKNLKEKVIDPLRDDINKP